MFQAECPGSITINAIAQAEWDTRFKEEKREALALPNETLKLAIDAYDASQSTAQRIIRTLTLSREPPKIAAAREVYGLREKLYKI
ncbi:MAG: hypothetical protein ABIA93_05120 [Candidatus Woesearchaeota archaeon]